jgi:hypothetical protein
MREDPVKQLYSVVDLAKVAGIGPDACRAAIRSGRIVPDYRTPSGVALFSAGTVEAWLRQRAERKRLTHEPAQAAA